jgi:hypothetical protein
MGCFDSFKHLEFTLDLKLQGSVRTHGVHGDVSFDGDIFCSHLHQTLMSTPISEFATLEVARVEYVSSACCPAIVLNVPSILTPRKGSVVLEIEVEHDPHRCDGYCDHGSEVFLIMSDHNDLDLEVQRNARGLC